MTQNLFNWLPNISNTKGRGTGGRSSNNSNSNTLVWLKNLKSYAGPVARRPSPPPAVIETRARARARVSTTALTTTPLPLAANRASILHGTKYQGNAPKTELWCLPPTNQGSTGKQGETPPPQDTNIPGTN
eukprot:jgi/Psemu1/29188/gm1.29188_g